MCPEVWDFEGLKHVNFNKAHATSFGIPSLLQQLWPVA